MKLHYKVGKNERKKISLNEKFSNKNLINCPSLAYSNAVKFHQQSHKYPHRFYQRKEEEIYICIIFSTSKVITVHLERAVVLSRRKKKCVFIYFQHKQSVTQAAAKKSIPYAFPMFLFFFLLLVFTND